MPPVKKAGLNLKVLLCLGIIVLLAFFWLISRVFSAQAMGLLVGVNPQSEDSSQQMLIENAEQDPSWQSQTSSQIDWSILYGSNEQARNQVSAAILEASNTYNLSPDLLRAVIMTESIFNSQAVSTKGARGLMQLMPNTALSLGLNNPHDARDNVMAGASYLASMFKQFNGDLRLSLAAYNAGSQSIRNSNGRIPAPVQPYVNKVISYYKLFRGKRDN